MGVDIEALRVLCEKATPGPWRECASEILIGDHWWRPVAHAHYRNEDDARFVAAARTALPAALDEVEALRSQLAAALAAKDEACNRWEWYAQRFGQRPTVDEYDYPRLAEVRKVGHQLAAIGTRASGEGK